MGVGAGSGVGVGDKMLIVCDCGDVAEEKIFSTFSYWFCTSCKKECYPKLKDISTYSDSDTRPDGFYTSLYEPLTGMTVTIFYSQGSVF